MAINVTRTKQQAAEIAGKVSQLRSARNRLAQYKAELYSNWQGREVGLFVQSIDDTIAKIDAMIGMMSTLSTDIRNAAEQIQREEEAAERAAAERAARAKANAQARSAYNAACNELDSIIKERQTVLQQMKNTKSLKTMLALNEQLKEIDKRISEAQLRCDQCRQALG